MDNGQKIEQLIKLLLGLYEVDELQEIIDNCQFCYSNPVEYITENDAEWIIEEDTEDAFDFAIHNELNRFLIVGDKIDEIHELIDEELNHTLGNFPDDIKWAGDYFNWLQLKLDKEKPQLEAIEIANSYSDELQLLIVPKDNVADIAILCHELNVRFRKTVQN